MFFWCALKTNDRWKRKWNLEKLCVCVCVCFVLITPSNQKRIIEGFLKYFNKSAYIIVIYNNATTALWNTLRPHKQHKHKIKPKTVCARPLEENGVNVFFGLCTTINFYEIRSIWFWDTHTLMGVKVLCVKDFHTAPYFLFQKHLVEVCGCTVVELLFCKVIVDVVEAVGGCCRRFFVLDLIVCWGPGSLYPCL